MKSVLYILAATILTFLASYSLGALLLERLRLKLYRSEERFFAFIAGSACLSSLVFVMTAAGVARKGTFLPVTAAILGVAVWRRAWRTRGPALPPIPRWWLYAFWVAFAGYTWLYLGQAMLPEASADGVSYHVGLVARYLREHRFPQITTNIYADLSEGAEMLFLYAFSIGKHSAAAMCEFLFLLALPFGVLSYARRIGHPVAGVVAAIVVYVTPVVGRTGTIAYNDVAGAAVVFALFYILQIWRMELQPRSLVLAGILAGFGYAIKYTLGAGVIYACVMVALVCWKRRQPVLKPLVTVAAFSAALIAPWMIKNIIEVSNPVAPFFTRVFPNPYSGVSFEDEYTGYLRHYDGVKPGEIPLEVTVRGVRLEGMLGPLFLLTPLALIALRWPHGRQLLLAAAVFLPSYAANIGARFLIPLVPFVALALSLLVEAWPAVAAATLVIHCALSWPQVIPLYATRYAWNIERSNWAAALRWIPEEQYLRTKLPDYDIGRVLDQTLPAKARVFSAAMGNQTYYQHELIVPFQSTFGSLLADTIYRASVGYMKPEVRDSFSFPARDVHRLRIVLTNAAKVEWAVAEVRVFEAGREIPRDPHWRLRASVNPWTVQRAFDNSPVTVWKSDYNGQPGMFLEIDFGSPRRVDQVTLDVPRNVDWATARIEGDGGFLTSRMVQTIVPLPPRMRRAAMEEMKANGIEWIVVRDNEFGATDFRTRYLQWGIRQAAERNGFRLWHIE